MRTLVEQTPSLHCRSYFVSLQAAGGQQGPVYGTTEGRASHAFSPRQSARTGRVQSRPRVRADRFCRRVLTIHVSQPELLQNGYAANTRDRTLSFCKPEFREAKNELPLGQQLAQMYDPRIANELQSRLIGRMRMSRKTAPQTGLSMPMTHFVSHGRRSPTEREGVHESEGWPTQIPMRVDAWCFVYSDIRVMVVVLSQKTGATGGHKPRSRGLDA